MLMEAGFQEACQEAGRPSLACGPRFTQMTASPDDLRRYAELVMAGMSAKDVHDADELACMIEDGCLRAWWLDLGGEIAGWCALAPGYGKYLCDDWHLYSGWVRSAMRGRGLGRLMWRFRMRLVPKGSPITVSIQPDKLASMAIARRLGFRLLRSKPPWLVYAFANH